MNILLGAEVETQQLKTTLTLYINRFLKNVLASESSPLALLRIVVLGTGDVGLIPITKTPRWCCWGHMPQSRIMAHMPAKIRGPPACAQPAFANCRMARLGVKSFLVVKHS
jgi:hypothetical protein